MTTTALGTPWEHGRFDAARGPRKILFGRMYEDTRIELEAFEPGGRVFCIASAGCTAMDLAREHEVVAVDINPVQLAYAKHRIEGGHDVRGMAERIMSFARFFAPLVGWRRSRVRAFLDATHPDEQMDLWRRHLDTRRFRFAFDALLSLTMLRSVYASPFLQFLPRRMGFVMRQRMRRCFVRHANDDNPYARLLLLGDAEPRARQTHDVELVHADAASYLESAPAGSFDGFTISNILDGADAAYRERLWAAIRRAASPSAMVVFRSFGEPSEPLPTNRAADDRSMLWGIVDVRPAADVGR